MKKWTAALAAAALLCGAAAFAAPYNQILWTAEPAAEAAATVKWVDFDLPADALTRAMNYDISSHGDPDPLNWVELLSCLGAKYGGDFSRYRAADLDELVQRRRAGASMAELTAGMAYYEYYTQAYGAVLNGFLGEYSEYTESDGQRQWVTQYGLKAFSPIARGFYFDHYDDFCAARTYGYNRKHFGHDLMCAIGTPIVAVESGVVEELGWNQYGDWRVGIRSFDGKRYYYYAHMRQNRPYHPDVRRGAVVRAGDVIGYVGRTGYSTVENTNNITTNHLHIGLELIFDEAQKDGPNQVWIDLYELTKFLQQHRSPVVRVADTKEYYRAVSYSEPDVEAYLRGELPQPFPSKSESKEGS